MKMRYIVCIFSIIMLGVMFGNVLIYYEKEEDSVDILFYNDKMKQMEIDYQEGMSQSDIEKIHECNLIPIEAPDYLAQLNKRLKDGDLILDFYVNGQLTGKAVWDTERQNYQKLKKQLFYKDILICMILMGIGYFIMIILYVSFIRPFNRLQNFTAEIAKGNLDFPLPMEKHNFFGAFTESFDIMREELQKAKEREYLANRSKKEVIAEVSHDIKTPLATIKAACEVIQVKEKNLDTLEKINVIAGKAEMIDSLVGNMFHATLEELEVLKVEVTEESSVEVEQMFRELKYYGEIVILNPVPECLVFMDKLRLQQVIDNIINNSYKYAGTEIDVMFEETGDGIQIKIQDRGTGVPDEELALITEKFYRGNNTKGKAGSGLGLYLVKEFMKQMGGGLECYNQKGFVVVLYIRKV